MHRIHRIGITRIMRYPSNSTHRTRTHVAPARRARKSSIRTDPMVSSRRGSRNIDYHPELFVSPAPRSWKKSMGQRSESYSKSIKLSTNWVKLWSRGHRRCMWDIRLWGAGSRSMADRPVSRMWTTRAIWNFSTASVSAMTPPQRR